jgi:hypothetical protein
VMRSIMYFTLAHELHNRLDMVCKV